MGIEGRRRPLFDLGSLVATPAALEVMQDRGVYGPALIKRHVTGDYGDICDEDRAANEDRPSVCMFCVIFNTNISNTNALDAEMSKKQVFLFVCSVLYLI